MNSEIYRALTEEYRLRREQNSRIESEREKEVFSAHPDIEKLCRERHMWILGGIDGILNGRDGGDLEKMMEDRNREIGDRLAACGYPRDYLAPVCRCPECRDTGYVGDVIRRECACFVRRARELEENRREKTAFDGASFDDFDFSVFPDVKPEGMEITQRKYMKTVVGACRAFADGYPRDKRNLILQGNTGLGKTYILKCVEKALSDRGLDTVYVTAYRLLDDLRNAYFRPGSRDTESFFECDLLIVDDLGMEPLFDNITVELLLNVLNERTLREKGVAVSTNLSLNNLKERYTERFFSRLMDTRVALCIPFYGTDLRLK